MNWRAGLIIATALVAVFGIPSLPRTHNHLIYWAIALVLEIVLLMCLKPYARRPPE